MKKKNQIELSPFSDDTVLSFSKKSPCPADGLTGFKQFLLGNEHGIKRRQKGFRGRKSSSAFSTWA